MARREPLWLEAVARHLRECLVMAHVGDAMGIRLERARAVADAIAQIDQRHLSAHARLLITSQDATPAPRTALSLSRYAPCRAPRSRPRRRAGSGRRAPRSCARRWMWRARRPPVAPSRTPPMHFRTAATRQWRSGARAARA